PAFETRWSGRGSNGARGRRWAFGRTIGPPGPLIRLPAMSLPAQLSMQFRRDRTVVATTYESRVNYAPLVRFRRRKPALYSRFPHQLSCRRGVSLHRNFHRTEQTFADLI